MNPVVQKLLRDAESLSGTPVQVVHDADLPISARIQFARNGASHHVLVVKPGPAADYAVANQLGFLTRLFSLPAEDRCDFLITPQAQQHAATLVDELLLPQRTLVGAGRAAISQSILQWTLAGARSNPIGMRIDQAIFRDMPALRGSFKAGVREQNNLNLMGLRNLQQNFRVPAALAGPSAAYALFMDRLLGGTSYSIPFEAMGFLDEGRTLIRSFDNVPATPASDRDLVDAWAAQMGVSDWYRWAPYSA